MGIYVKINIYKLEPFDHTCSAWKYSALFSRVDLQQIEGPWGGSRYNRIYIYIQTHIQTLYTVYIYINMYMVPWWIWHNPGRVKSYTV